MKGDAATLRRGDTARSHNRKALPFLTHKMRHDKDGLTCCYVCGCTELKPCNPPCGWAFDDVCSACADAASVLAIWRENAHAPKLSRLLAVSFLSDLVRGSPGPASPQPPAPAPRRRRRP